MRLLLEFTLVHYFFCDLVAAPPKSNKISRATKSSRSNRLLKKTDQKTGRQAPVTFDYVPEVIQPNVCLPPIAPSYEVWCEAIQERQRGTATTRSSNLRSPTIGQNITALVLLVRFPEHGDRLLPTKGYIEDMCRRNMTEYFRRQSYGRYIVRDCYVHDWYTIPYSQALYSNTLSNIVGSEYASSFFLPVLQDLEDNSNSSFWDRFDSNRNGAIDVVLAFHSGYAAEFGRGGACGVDNRLERFHSQGHPSSPAGVWSGSSVRLNGYAITSAFDWVCEHTPATLGIAVHEWMHILGAIDLYDGSTGKLGGIGSFGIMASPRGIGRDGHPAGMTAYMKQRLGWIDHFQEIEVNGEYELRPLNFFPEAYAIRIGFSDEEYLLLEYREAKDDDIELFGGGLFIYHINGRQRGQRTSGYPGREGWPENLNVYKVALLQADGRYDLEMGVNNGDAGDVWRPGMVLGPGYTDESFPNTDSYFNGPTGIVIEILDSLDSQNMRFRISGLPSNSTSTGPVPESTDPPTTAPGPPSTSPSTQSPSIPSRPASVGLSVTPSNTIVDSASAAPQPATILAQLVPTVWVPLGELFSSSPVSVPKESMGPSSMHHSDLSSTSSDAAMGGPRFAPSTNPTVFQETTPPLSSRARRWYGLEIALSLLVLVAP